MAALPASAADDAPRPEDDASLSTLRAAHPRLILTDTRLEELQELLRTDPRARRYCDQVLAEADRLADAPPLRHELIGPRLLQVSRECLRRVYALALAYRLTGQDRYARAAERNLLTVCAFPDWNPSHFLDTAEMTHAVAIGYDWLHDALPEGSRRTIREGLLRLGLEPGLACYRGEQRHGWWVQADHNWNQVCNGGLLIGALAVADTDPSVSAEILRHARASLPRALATYAPDGAWPEGPGYWAYATDYTVYALAALQTALGQDFGLSQAPGLAQAGRFPIESAGPTGLFLNFADVGERSRLRTQPSLFWLARQYDEPFLAEAQRALLERAAAGPRDLVWYVPPPTDAATGEARPLDRLFRGPVEIALFRSAWDEPNALFAGVKAGANTVNHAHLDLGSFEFDALGVRWARDLGSDDYNLPDYWDARPGGKRWQYYRLNSRSHSVPLIDGHDQRVDAEARVLRFEAAPPDGRPFVTIDLTAAYRDAATRVTRGLALLNARRALLVQDEFELSGSHEVLWAMTTDAAVALDPDDPAHATLTLAGHAVEARLLAPAGAAFAVESAERPAPEKPNEGVRRLVVRLPGASGTVRVAVLLAPAWPDGHMAPAPPVEPLDRW